MLFSFLGWCGRIISYWKSFAAGSGLYRRRLSLRPFILKKEEKKLTGEIKRCEGMLGNPNFVNKAPEKKIAEEREKLEKYKGMMEQVKERLTHFTKA